MVCLEKKNTFLTFQLDLMPAVVIFYFSTADLLFWGEKKFDLNSELDFKFSTQTLDAVKKIEVGYLAQW